MAVHNAYIASLFYRMAELLELQDANPFRVRAYRRAATTIESWPESLPEMVGSNRDLADMPDIGEDLAAKVVEICKTGHLAALADLQAQMPAALVALSAVPELGPKRLAELREVLGVATIDDLNRACAAGKVRHLPSFDTALEARLLRTTSPRTR